MTFAELAVALDFAAVLGLFGHVALRPRKSALHALLLGALFGALLWSGGALLRDWAEPRVALAIRYAGVLCAAPLWLLFAARYGRAPLVLERGATAVGLAVPSAIGVLALLTNDAHRLLFAKDASGGLYTGPLLWVFLVWAFACAASASAVLVRSARQSGDSRASRRTGRCLALAGAIPMLSGLLLLGAGGLEFGPAPSGLCMSAALLALVSFRDDFLDSLSAPRRCAIEQLHAGVVIAGERGRILALNPAAERILGRTVSSLRGVDLGEALLALAEPSERAALAAALQGTGAGNAFELELGGEEGRRVELRGGAAAPRGRFVVMRDRSEEHRFERIARQTQKLRTVGTLAAGIAHEVNNPLAFIRANLTHLHRLGERVSAAADGPDAKLAGELADLESMAAESLDGVERISRIVEDMRRLASGSEEGFVPLRLNDAVGDALRLSRVGRDDDVELVTRLDPSLPELSGSPQRIVQVLLNLLVNARQALAETAAPRIEIDTRRQDGFAVVSVCDNGPGIPEDVLERIFDPFFTTKSPDRGMGLGLSIAFDIVREHGGVCEAQQRPGEGARFVVRLPIPCA